MITLPIAECCSFDAIVIGTSSGGLAALDEILPKLRSKFCLPILIVQHISPTSENYLPVHYQVRCSLKVKEADDKEPIERNTIYFAPPNYHMMVESDRNIALSADERINFCRPSIDVLFETAATAYKDRLIGIILTGANSDGANGLARIKMYGGLTIVQNPKTAEVDTMPQAAIELVDVDHTYDLNEIAQFLNGLCATKET